MSTHARPTSVVAIVPAAGRSGRMGKPKQLLDVDGRPMLLGVAQALLDGGATRVTIVVSTALRQQLPPLPPAVDVAINDDPASAMIDSIRIGLESATADGYMICPADVPGLTAADVRRCVDTFAAEPDQIVIATHGGRRGHPIIVPAALAAVVRSRECDAGLNQLARNRPALVREVVCDSPGTVANVNTPADYESLQ